MSQGLHFYDERIIRPIGTPAARRWQSFFRVTRSGTIAKVMGQAACPVGRLYDQVNGIGKTTNTYLPWPGVIANHEFEPEQMQNALREQ